MCEAGNGFALFEKEMDIEEGFNLEQIFNHCLAGKKL